MSFFVDSLRRSKPGDLEPMMSPLWDAAQDSVAVPVVDIQQVYDYVMRPVWNAFCAKQVPAAENARAIGEIKTAIFDSGAPLRPLFRRMWMTWRWEHIRGRRAEDTVLWELEENVKLSEELTLPRAWVGHLAHMSEGDGTEVWTHCLVLQLGENDERIYDCLDLPRELSPTPLFSTRDSLGDFLTIQFVVIQAALYHMAWKKEIRLVEHPPCRQQKRQAAREGLPHPSTFHVLDISPWVRKVNAAVAREVGSGATGAQRQHVVCGHRKTFTPSGPIGGCKLCLTTGHPDYPAWNKFPHVGSFWVDSFVAGNPDRGVVEKSYQVVCP